MFQSNEDPRPNPDQCPITGPAGVTARSSDRSYLVNSLHGSVSDPDVWLRGF